MAEHHMKHPCPCHACSPSLSCLFPALTSQLAQGASPWHTPNHLTFLPNMALMHPQVSPVAPVPVLHLLRPPLPIPPPTHLLHASKKTRRARAPARMPPQRHHSAPHEPRQLRQLARHVHPARGACPVGDGCCPGAAANWQPRHSRWAGAVCACCACLCVSVLCLPVCARLCLCACPCVCACVCVTSGGGGLG